MSELEENQKEDEYVIEATIEELEKGVELSIEKPNKIIIIPNKPKSSE